MSKTLTTSDQAVMNVFAALSSLKAAANLTGSIYPYNRPEDSDKEDVVIRALVFGAQQEQNGLLNVNIHVPNLSLPAADNSQPNRPRFHEIAHQVILLLKEKDADDFTLTLDRAGELIPDGGPWFHNIRVRYNTIRLDK